MAAFAILGVERKGSRFTVRFAVQQQQQIQPKEDDD